MGEDVAGARRPTHERPTLEGVLVVDAFNVIAPFFKLRNEAAFHELTEYLVGLSCRDQEDQDTTDELDAAGVTWPSRRSEGHRLALSLRDNAAAALKCLNRIDDDEIRPGRRNPPASP
jgi:hypothetical protein